MIAQIDREYIRTSGLSAAAKRLGSYVFFEGRPAVVRGQWFNPVVKANLKAGMRLYRGKAIDRPVFIVGVGRSGTTHLGRLISAHHDVAWINEPKMIWNLIRDDEDVSGYYAPHGRFALSSSDATAEVRDRAERLFGYYLSMMRSKRVVDKYPEMTYRIPFLRALFPGCKIVAIVRRPDDFVNSILAWNAANARLGEDWWGVRDRKWVHMCRELVPMDRELGSALGKTEGRAPTASEKAATEWVLGMRSILGSSGDVDAVVRYEDLVLDPRGTIGGLLEACELSRRAKVLDLAERSTSSRLRDETADFGVVADPVLETRLALGV